MRGEKSVPEGVSPREIADSPFNRYHSAGARVIALEGSPRRAAQQVLDLASELLALGQPCAVLPPLPARMRRETLMTRLEAEIEAAVQAGLVADVEGDKVRLSATAANAMTFIEE